MIAQTQRVAVVFLLRAYPADTQHSSDSDRPISTKNPEKLQSLRSHLVGIQPACRLRVNCPEIP